MKIRILVQIFFMQKMEVIVPTVKVTPFGIVIEEKNLYCQRVIGTMMELIWKKKISGKEKIN